MPGFFDAAMNDRKKKARQPYPQMMSEIKRRPMPEPGDPELIYQTPAQERIMQSAPTPYPAPPKLTR